MSQVKELMLMPTYEYRCESCGTFEAFQKMTADPLKSCPECQGKVERLISYNPHIIFKGSGFYVTDYGRGSSSNGNGVSGNGEKKETKAKDEKKTTSTESSSQKSS